MIAIAGLLIPGTGGSWLEQSKADDPIPHRLPAPPVTTSTIATAAPANPQVLDPQPSRPIDVPDDPYAREPLVEIGTIEIPKIGLTHRMFHGITLNNIDHGPSHWPGSAYPGQIGNAVIAGHRVTHSRPFRNIDQLAPGDQVIFTVRGTRAVYAVVGREIVTPKATWIANPTPTPTATLFACHPPGSAKLRYVVRLALVSTGLA
ncbi:MAG TPA: class E sortase [bacterium]|nr:class E sortase [bacterium]